MPHQRECSFWVRSTEVGVSPEDRWEPPSSPSPPCGSVSGLVLASEGRGNVILELTFLLRYPKAKDIDSNVVLPLYCDCHLTYSSFSFDLLSCIIMGFSLNFIINSAL